MADEKTKTQLLRERVLTEENKGKKLTAEVIAKADEFCEGYKEFLDCSPVEREAVAYSLDLAKKNGFVKFDPDATYLPGDKVYHVNRGKAIALAVIGKRTARVWLLPTLTHRG